MTSPLPWILLVVILTLSFVSISEAHDSIEDGRCKTNADCLSQSSSYPCCSKFGYCGHGPSYCQLTPTKSPEDCKNQFPNVQFENIWRKDLLELAEGGFAKKFQNMKFKPTKFGNRIKVGIIGSGPAGLVTAYELSKFAIETKSSVDITIIEKEKRMGGRIKTVGKLGHFLPTIWGKDKLAATDAGAMRLPLTPQKVVDCKYKSICAAKGLNCAVPTMSDAEIQHLVHGTGGYDFIETGSFPHPLIRHYIKTFKVPVFRHNFGQTAHDIDGMLFVRQDSGEFVCKKCSRYAKDITVDQHIFEKVKELDSHFAEQLQQNHNGSLIGGFEQTVNGEVWEWMKRHSVILEDDYSKQSEQLVAWRQFQDDWSMTYREHFLKKGWPDLIIDLLGTTFQVLTEYRIRDDIIETKFGRYWQPGAMFSVKYGMHSVFQMPEDVSEPSQTAFYEEIMKMANAHGNLNVKFNFGTRIEKIEKTANGRVTLYKGPRNRYGFERVDSFDAIVSTIPAPFIRHMDIVDNGKVVNPSEKLFGYNPLFKMMIQFKTPFWLDSRNNRGGFVVTDAQGFLTSSNVVGRLRYPRRTDEAGNIVMMYVFEENAENFVSTITSQGFMKNTTCSWKDGEFDEKEGVKEAIEMAMEQLQRFHPPIDIRKEFTGNYFVQPWIVLSGPPSGYHQMKKLQKYTNVSPKGIYFAGDGFSFKPQWIDGAFYTAHHALFRLINDYTNSKFEDPFKSCI